jgi:hypothetical protein
MLSQKILRRGADDHLIDFHLGRLLDCVSDRWVRLPGPAPGKADMGKF